MTCPKTHVYLKGCKVVNWSVHIGYLNFSFIFLPYLVGAESFKTEVKKNTLSPNWSETFEV